MPLEESAGNVFIPRPTVTSRRDEAKITTTTTTPTVTERRDEAKIPSVPSYDVQSVQTIEPEPKIFSAGLAFQELFQDVSTSLTQPTPEPDITWGDYYSGGSSYQPAVSNTPTNVWVGQGGLGGDLSKVALVDASRQTALAFFGAAYGGDERYGLAENALIPTQVSDEVANNMAAFFNPQSDAGKAMWEESFGFIPESTEEGMVMLGYYQQENGDWARYDSEEPVNSYLGTTYGRGYGGGYGYPSYARAGSYNSAGGYAASGLINWRIS